MTDYKRQHERECPPTTEDPADQPKPPGDGDVRGHRRRPTPPKLPTAGAVSRPTDCNCPTAPGSTPNCLEDLIAKQADEIAAADEGQGVQGGSRSAARQGEGGQPGLHARQVRRRWSSSGCEQDAEIAELISKLVCAVAVLALRHRVLRLPAAQRARTTPSSGSTATARCYADVHNLYDLQYWHTRDKDAEGAHVRSHQGRARGLGEAGGDDREGPRRDNATLLDDAATSRSAPQPGKVRLRPVPQARAAAPGDRAAGSGSKWTTRIDKEYTEFCECDAGEPDDCCGPDVGELSLRQRLIGPQPYLIDPNDYFTLICCLVEKRYAPAKDALERRRRPTLAAVDDQIKRYQGADRRTARQGGFEKDAKARDPERDRLLRLRAPTTSDVEADPAAR